MSKKTSKKDEIKICPRCLGEYTGFPALSRRNNETDICPPCGTEEAMFDMSNAHNDAGWWLQAKEKLVETKGHEFGSVDWQNAMIHNVRHKLLNGIELNGTDMSFLEIQRDHTQELREQKRK